MDLQSKAHLLALYYAYKSVVGPERPDNLNVFIRGIFALTGLLSISSCQLTIEAREMIPYDN